MKEFLSREGVPFVAKNVDEDERAYDELVAGGFLSVPITVSGDRAVAGYDPRALAEVVEAWRAAADPDGPQKS